MFSPHRPDYDIKKEIVDINAEITSISRLVDQTVFIDDNETKEIEDRIDNNIKKIETLKSNAPSFEIEIKKVLKEQLLVCKKYNDKKRNIEIRAKQITHAKMNKNGTLDVISEDKAEELVELERMMDDSSLASAKYRLHEILENRIDIKRIERSMLDLQILLNDLSRVGNEQGEIIDRTAVNIEGAKDLVVHGRKELKEAKEYDKAGSKKMCYCCLIIFAVLACIGVAIALGVTLPGK